MTGREGGLALFAGWVLYRLLLRRPNLQIKGSLIVVTGASQGVGREICKQLTARGGDVIMVARSWGLLDATRLEIENRGWGGHAYVEACDCSDEDSVSLMAERVVRNHGVPDVVVNCAGQGSWRFLHEMQCDDVRGCLNVPTLATAFVAKSFLPHMTARGGGSIAIVQSPISRAAIAGATAYDTARYALRGLHHGLCQDVSGSEITVQEIVLPGLKSDYWTNNPGSIQRMPWLTPYLGLSVSTSSATAASWVIDAVEKRTSQAAYGFPLPLYLSLLNLIPGLVHAFHFLNRISGHTLLRPLPGASALPRVQDSFRSTPQVGICLEFCIIPAVCTRAPSSPGSSPFSWVLSHLWAASTFCISTCLAIVPMWRRSRVRLGS